MTNLADEAIDARSLDLLHIALGNPLFHQQSLVQLLCLIDHAFHRKPLRHPFPPHLPHFTSQAGVTQQAGNRLGQSIWIARGDEDTCNACETCMKRCPVDAISVGKFASVDMQLCLGCGVCVPTCPTEAIGMKRRPESDQAEMSDNIKEAMT